MKKSGLMLMEFLCVVAIISFLVALTFPMLVLASRKAVRLEQEKIAVEAADKSRKALRLEQEKIAASRIATNQQVSIAVSTNLPNPATTNIQAEAKN